MSGQKILNLGDILDAKCARVELIDVPQLGGAVYIRVLSGRERDKFESQVRAAKHGLPENVRAKWCALALSREDGSRLCSDADIPRLAELPSTVLDVIMGESQRLNGMADEVVEELEKNLESDQSDDSGLSCL